MACGDVLVSLDVDDNGNIVEDYSTAVYCAAECDTGAALLHLKELARQSDANCRLRRALRTICDAANDAIEALDEL